MGLMTALDVIKSIGGAAGAIISITAVWGLIAKKPTAWLKRNIKEQIEESNTDIRKYIAETNEERKKMLTSEISQITSSLDNISAKIEKDQEAAQCSLRHSITTIYEEYKEEKQLPTYVKEDLCKMYDSYVNLNGNSYVHEIYEKMMNWEEK